MQKIAEQIMERINTIVNEAAELEKLLSDLKTADNAADNAIAEVAPHEAAAKAIRSARESGYEYWEMLPVIYAHPDWRFEKRMEVEALREIESHFFRQRKAVGIKNPAKLRVITSALSQAQPA